MRTAILNALVLAMLCACASRTPVPATYGNFLKEAPGSEDKALADDAVRQLTLVMAPASTRLELQHGSADGFGTPLVAGLRAKGYALREFQGEAPAGQGATEAVEAAPAEAPTKAVSMRYIVDRPAESNLYRVTLLLGSHSLTRAYVAQNGTVYPAGSWAYKE